LENARLYEQAQQEIADRRRAETRIKASLEEKEVLLKEIHHRVKNNLQVISSLLHLQSLNIEDDTTLGVLQESRNRVGSMALVHETLYQATDLARVDFADYARSLSGYLFQSYGVDADLIRQEIKVEDVALSIDAAIPCGLILNELISNVLKHAFPSRQTGRVCVEFRSDLDGWYTLSVGDDGIGLPEDLDFRDTDSLGFQLVNTLVDQLGGTIELDNSRGTVFTIRFADPSGGGEEQSA
jgi:two-component sensor histidine kinase